MKLEMQGLKSVHFFMGDENSSEDEELRLIVWYEKIGLTLIRAVL